MTENEKRKTPPYLSFKTFQTFLDGLKVAVPSHIDRSIMKTMSGGAQSGLISALTYMGLMTSDSVPTDRLKVLVDSEGNERQRLLGELWRETYANLNISFDTTTSKQLEEALEAAGATGETVLKCKGFLLALAKVGGVKLSPYLRGSGRRPRTIKTKRVTSSHEGNGSGTNYQSTEPAKSPEQFLIDILDPTKMEETEQQAVWTLIKYLKKQCNED